MDFLKAEIARKKRLIEEKQVLKGPQNKYFKRGDLAAKQEQEYLDKYGPKLPKKDEEDKDAGEGNRALQNISILILFKTFFKRIFLQFGARNS